MTVRLLLITSVLILTPRAEELYKCVENVNDAFLRADYGETIRRGDSCFEQLISAARGEQVALQSKNTVLPTGRISEFERYRIFRNAALNSLSTVLYLKGIAAEHLFSDSGDKRYDGIAVEAYKLLCSCYSLGRKWSASGVFTSPCEDIRPKLLNRGISETSACRAWNK